MSIKFILDRSIKFILYTSIFRNIFVANFTFKADLGMIIDLI